MSTITFAGNLAYDPEARYTPNGKPVVRLTIIENRPRRNSEGEWEDGVPNTFQVEVWGHDAENVLESCRKGDRVLVVGRVATSRWNDPETAEPRSRQIITAAEIGYSLKFHTVRATKANRTQTRQTSQTNAAGRTPTVAYDPAQNPTTEHGDVSDEMNLDGWDTDTDHSAGTGDGAGDGGAGEPSF